MNATDNVTNPTKGRPTSIPLLIGVGVLGVAAYFAGPTVMAYYFLFQEEAKAKAIYESVNKQNMSDSGGFVASSDMTSVGGPPGGAGGQRRDPEELFKQRDENGDGKLEGSEISERMQARMATVDKNGDGVVSKEEFMEGMQRRSGGNDTPPAPSSDAIQTDPKSESATTPSSDEPVKETPK